MRVLLAASLCALLCVPALALGMTGPKTFTVKMLGKNEVPKGSPTAGGTAIKAPKGKAGNVVVPSLPES